MGVVYMGIYSRFSFLKCQFILVTFQAVFVSFAVSDYYGLKRQFF